MRGSKNYLYIVKSLSLLLFAVFVFSACGSEGFSAIGKPDFSDPSFQRTPPPVLMPEFSGVRQEVREDNGRVGIIDLSNLENGYVGVNCIAPTRGKFRISKGAQGTAEYTEYTYDISTDGQNEFFPLAMGSGEYTATIFLNLEGGQYEYFLTATAQVELSSQFAPFIVPNKIVNYTPESEAVNFSYSLAANASTDLEVVQQVYFWIQKNIVYDEAKATKMVGTNTIYVPDPDETLQTKTGICYDYAALAATMLRANGIPCQLIMGDVLAGEKGTVYHAWNMIWLKDKGWVAVKLPSTPEEWQRIDLTFAATGGSSISEFIGDGSNYFEMSVH